VAAGAATGSSVAAAAGSTVNVGTSTNFGSVLTNAGGFALYTFPSDHNGMSACTGVCMTVWPALTVAAGTTPTAGTGVSGTVAAVVQANGTYQVTYNGAPLYTFVSDTTPGQVSGNGVGGFAVVQVSSAPAPTTTVPATTTPTTSPPSTPTTAAPAGTATTSPPAASSAQAAHPATAAAGSTAGTSSGTASGSAGTGGTLALTGPGPSLMWLGIVGAGLLALSLSVLGILGGRSRRRRSVGET
jgi:predicted lipoprotein with Yx(FWY)xxD motif